MFEKEEMMVSVLTAEQKIKEERKSAEKQYDELKKDYQQTVNEMKLKSHHQGVLILQKHTYTFGEPTPFYSHGFQLFTGDEVAFPSGRKGIIVNISGTYYVETNKGAAKLIDIQKYNYLNRQFMLEGYVHGNLLTITKHFNLYEDVEDIV